MPGKVHIKTYGCQMNERDSEAVAALLAERGWVPAASEDEADVVLVNTCSIRDQAERKAIGKLGLVASRKRLRPELIVGAMGCMAQSRGAELLRRVRGLDLVVGTQRFHQVPELIEDLARAGVRAPRVLLEPTPRSLSELSAHRPLPGRVTAFVSIMRGCNQRCSFCIVPSTRGEEESRPVEEICGEVEAAVAAGVKEVTLLGQIVTSYGMVEQGTRGGLPFVRLLERLHAIDGLARIRFASPHPKGFRQELIDAIRDLPLVCEHVHLPLQSGSDRILRAMRRGYTRRHFLARVERLRAAVPQIAITSDIIVGFPGETDADFGETVRVVTEADFDNAFVFRYSARRDTKAAALAGQLPEPVKMERNRELLAVLEAQSLRHNQALVGSAVEVLVEGPSPRNADRLTGRTRTNRIVIFPGEAGEIGRLRTVRVKRARAFALYGELAPEPGPGGAWADGPRPKPGLARARGPVRSRRFASMPDSAEADEDRRDRTDPTDPTDRSDSSDRSDRSDPIT